MVLSLTLMANNSWEKIDAKLEKLIEVMGRRYGSTTTLMDHLEESVDTAFATSRMDRIEASLATIKKKVDALTHSIDCGLSPSDGLHKNFESTLTTDAPFPIVVIDMEDSIMSKVLTQLESCEDEQDEVVWCAILIFFILIQHGHSWMRIKDSKWV
ncbi:uncharacterized protein G2W53_041972 [Senna tora]|uniref:Uncharacterized protein n=1 Tax=Senna tora TaxID=362788 RepID=A0A834SG27_9FABA|nr:uncharacterized protein G2W53_041972 [Senna tora]